MSKQFLEVDLTTATTEPAIVRLSAEEWRAAEAEVIAFRPIARRSRRINRKINAGVRPAVSSGVALNACLGAPADLRERDAIGSDGRTWPGSVLKRTMDVIIATLAIISLLPIAAVVAVLIRLSMGGPVVFRQRRVGRHGRIFGCYKFRTMVSDADVVLQRLLDQDPEAAEEWRNCQKLRNDPRITWLGHLLRKTSLDELPQFINVLRGEMSCVGPRPIVPEELQRYGRYAPDYLMVLPGLTGLWQVSGRTKLTYADRIKLDRCYARRQSIGLDIAILAQTVPAVLRTDEVA